MEQTKTAEQLFNQFCQESGMDEAEVKRTQWYKDGMIDYTEWLLDAAQRPTVAPNEKLYRWVKASERLPKEDGYYFVKSEDGEDYRRLFFLTPATIEPWFYDGACYDPYGGIVGEWLEQLTPEQAAPVAPDYDCVCVRCNREGHAKEWQTVGIESQSGYGGDPICDECYKELIGEQATPVAEGAGDAIKEYHKWREALEKAFDDSEANDFDDFRDGAEWAKQHFEQQVTALQAENQRLEAQNIDLSCELSAIRQLNEWLLNRR